MGARDGYAGLAAAGVEISGGRKSEQSSSYSQQVRAVVLRLIPLSRSFAYRLYELYITVFFLPVVRRSPAMYRGSLFSPECVATRFYRRRCSASRFPAKRR